MGMSSHGRARLLHPFPLRPPEFYPFPCRPMQLHSEHLQFHLQERARPLLRWCRVRRALTPMTHCQHRDCLPHVLAQEGDLPSLLWLQLELRATSRARSFLYFP